jgi:hypothetical protein
LSARSDLFCGFYDIYVTCSNRHLICNDVPQQPIGCKLKLSGEYDMSRIEISNLNSKASFLTDLSATETTNIIGGSEGKKGKGKGKGEGEGYGGGYYGGGHYGGGYSGGGYSGGYYGGGHYGGGEHDD